ncbi:MAG: transglycosylase SLT domain-containing protein, partial [Myxococcota bacterium]|nr:transglycosylase SLT domain-containing protein [Myxococcota bacterium]
KLEWTAKERLLAAQFRYDRVQHDEVIETVAPLLEQARTHPPQDATQLGNHCQALWLTAMTYRRSKRSPRAVPFYEEMLQSCAEHGDYGQRARFGLAQAALRNDDKQRAREELEAILTRWPKGRYADDAVTELIRLDLADGAYEKALNRAEAIIDGTLSGDLAGEALWLLAQEERAFANFDTDTASASQVTRQRRWVERARASQSDDPSYFSQGRLDYFAAYLARDDAKTAAEAARDAIEAAPFSFYACASAALLSTLDREEAAVTEALSIWQAQIAGLRSEPAVEQRFLVEDSPLARAGLRWALLGHTARAAEWLAPLSEDQDSVAWLVAYSLHLEGRFARSHDLARRELREWQRVADPAHRFYWQIAYPQAYPELVAHYASALDLPEALILAIMREESAFQARVESFAHAIGLMQLLASTGIDHAERDLGWTIDAQDLREPQVNIAVGAAFLAHLRKRLHTHPSVVAAGYNAGRGAVGRWLKDEPEALATFVERIPYTETRDYSKRVSASYMVYQVLYGSSDVELFELEI